MTDQKIEISCCPTQFLQTLYQLLNSPLSSDLQKKVKLLSPCEKNVLFYIAELKTGKEIADVLFVSTHTIRKHEINIRLKTGLTGRNTLKKFALNIKPYLDLSLNSAIKNTNKIKNGGGNIYFIEKML